MAIDLEADRQSNLLLTEENLTSEREVVRNERLVRTVNTPYGLARELLLSQAYQRHPYRWPVVGWDPDLLALSLEDCQAYFRTYYAASNTTVVIVGDFRHAEALQRVQDAYGHLPARPAPPPVVTLEDPQRGERRAIYRKTLEAPALFAAFHVPAAAHPDTAPLLLLAGILSGGRSSRFHRRFVRSGRAGMVRTDIGSSFLNQDPSLFHLDVVANPGDSLPALEAEVWEEVDRLLQGGVEMDEVRRAARQLLADLVLRNQAAFSRGLQLGLYQIRAGDWRFPGRLAAALAVVSAADVERVARTYLQADSRTVVSVLPEGA
jgi:predicted Zn-dependent peptidase